MTSGESQPAVDGSAPVAKASAAEVFGAVEHLFRHEAGKMIAVLTRIFGVDNLSLAEDVVQETLARALQTWPFYGIPQNPSAWIMRAARNRALDVVRREQNFREKEAEIVRVLDRPVPAPDTVDPLETEIADDCLRMMFVCCHPDIPGDAQAALALKTLCGFGVGEIARAFLAGEAAIAKRLTRAKQHIRDAGIRFEIPDGEELGNRLDGVLQTLYLLFNEGYKASTGDRLVREDVCREAIRLTTLLAGHPSGNQPRTHALLALMLLNAARFPARVDDDGNLLRLQEQDRSLWDRALIARGMYHLARSATGSQITAYHLQAGIAACHTAVPSYEQTDWKRILGLYDQLLRFDASPVVALNRAIAVAHVEGPKAALAAVAAIPDRDRLESYYLLYAVLGEFEALLNDHLAAVRHFRKAIELAHLKSEQTFLARRSQESEDRLKP